MAKVTVEADSDNEVQDYDDIDDMEYELPSGPAASASGSSSSSAAARGTSSSEGSSSFAGPSSLMNMGMPGAAGSGAGSAGGAGPGARVISPSDMGQYKHYSVIYPIYLDARFAHKNGERRVSKAKAVRFPKAQEIAEVCGRLLGLPPVFEPEKTHPRDWQNPGRVRVLIKDKTSRKPLNASIPDKYVLLNKLCDGIRMLRQYNPTPSTSILSRLPYYSPALSFGTYEEALKGGGKMNEMMRGMLGGAMPGGAGAGAVAGPDDEEVKKRQEEKELAEKQRIAKLKALNKQGRRMVRR